MAGNSSPTNTRQSCACPPDRNTGGTFGAYSETTGFATRRGCGEAAAATGRCGVCAARVTTVNRIKPAQENAVRQGILPAIDRTSSPRPRSTINFPPATLQRQPAQQAPTRPSTPIANRSRQTLPITPTLRWRFSSPAWLSAPRSLHDLNRKIPQLPSIHRPRRVGHQIASLLRLRERNAVSNTIEPPKQHHPPVDPQRNTPMRRGAILQRI